ncbi:MAG: T9SS type A sorting domain-containing protein [Bacteroidales bacterium]|nr:T9SS type A sorting domain-containing protein [Bacteroidales bacterium]MBN2819706.1 T9SS type A sorting domain-containing protein [Bacteroidales bacterium]
MKVRNIIYLFAGLLLLLSVIAVKQGFLIENDPRIGYDKPEGFYDYFKSITTPLGQKESGYKPNYTFAEYNKALKNKTVNFKSTEDLEWIQRGPGNVGGRTRTVIIDPDDNTGNTWFAGSVSGGIWKTTDGGNSWENLTSNLPNLSTAVLAIAASNTSVIYAGTGEGYGGEGMVTGNGIFVSRNKGNTWEHLASTKDDKRFRFINKIWISPDDDSVLVVATNKGLFKSLDAGESWINVYYKGYAVQDLIQNPKNPQVLFAGVNALGVIRSNNAGDTWGKSFEGIAECRRVSLTISPVDTSILYAGVESPTAETQIYRSEDGGKSWCLNYNTDDLFVNFHQTQGWFNNVVAAHPFDKNKVYIGGVYFGLLEFRKTKFTSQPTVVRVDTVGTGSFMSFVNFGASFFRGAISTGLVEDADVEVDDFVSVEIRFGNGLKQKAHRFSVPEGEGAGVPPQYYHYEDYVDVPFQVWDLDNDQQLMISFRDQDRDGTFNLSERVYGDDISGREYIFISAYPYNSSTPEAEILQDGYESKLLYFIWPTLEEDKEWKPAELPEATMNIKFGTITYQDAYTTVLADDRLNENLHVDHHDIKFFVTDHQQEKFNIIESNDGGLGFSGDGGKTWEQINKGYLTTQFYGVAKRPGMHEYIGGMQDNGTWQSPLNSVADANSEYTKKIEGDGFEVLWHPLYPNRILGSVYNNYIEVSNDFGESWEWSIDGLNGDGPFITKLSNSIKNPNLVFVVGSKGLYKHINFGYGHYEWQLIDLGEGWSVNETVTSMHHVKVSLADPAVIWAGGGMFENPDLHLFVSKDFGETFDSTEIYKNVELGFISGLATHPTNPAEAFVLFSFRNKPKVLRTMDFGKTWEDISGFGTDSTSSNGFPDVVVSDLLVMPYDTNIIWAGTEIGLFESADNGQSWNYANNGLPPVSIWKMDIFDGNVVVATHGRGIWTADLNLSAIPEILPDKTWNTKLYPNPADASVNIDGKFSNGSLEIKIISITGKIIEQYSKSILNNEETISLNTSQIANGNYIIQLNQGEQVQNLKLIVVH